LVGVYFANELVNDKRIPPYAAKIGHKIDDILGGGAAVLMVGFIP
jgi:hypothetical protein